MRFNASKCAEMRDKMGNACLKSLKNAQRVAHNLEAWVTLV